MIDGFDDDDVPDYSPGPYRVPDDGAVILAVEFVDEPGGYGASILGCVVDPPMAVAMLRSLADSIERDVVPKFLGDLS